MHHFCGYFQILIESINYPFFLKSVSLSLTPIFFWKMLNSAPGIS
jgi:hypothetical protein